MSNAILIALSLGTVPLAVVEALVQMQIHAVELPDKDFHGHRQVKKLNKTGTKSRVWLLN